MQAGAPLLRSQHRAEHPCVAPSSGAPARPSQTSEPPPWPAPGDPLGRTALTTMPPRGHLFASGQDPGWRARAALHGQEGQRPEVRRLQGQAVWGAPRLTLAPRIAPFPRRPPEPAAALPTCCPSPPWRVGRRLATTAAADPCCSPPGSPHLLVCTDPRAAPVRVPAHQQAAEERVARVRRLAVRPVRAPAHCACLLDRGAEDREEGAQAAGCHGAGQVSSYLWPTTPCLRFFLRTHLSGGCGLACAIAAGASPPGEGPDCAVDAPHWRRSAASTVFIRD